MKTLIQIPKYMALALAALALAAWIATPSPAAAQEKGAAAANLIKHTPAPGSASTVAVKTSEKAANGCSNCRVSLVKVAERPAKTGAAPESKLITRNACSECVNVLATVGTGKLAKATLANSCAECCKLDPKCCETQPICCIANAVVRPARPAVMARN